MFSTGQARLQAEVCAGLKPPGAARAIGIVAGPALANLHYADQSRKYRLVRLYASNSRYSGLHSTGFAQGQTDLVI